METVERPTVGGSLDAAAASATHWRLATGRARRIPLTRSGATWCDLGGDALVDALLMVAMFII